MANYPILCQHITRIRDNNIAEHQQHTNCIVCWRVTRLINNYK